MTAQPRILCIGSGVAGDVWEHPHPIKPGTEVQMFPARRSRGKSNSFSAHFTRCWRCRSTRYLANREDCGQKAGATFKYHAHKHVEYGFCSTYDEAVDLLNGVGSTRDYIQVGLVAAYGQECPGLCCDAWLEDGAIVITRSRITNLRDLNWDWRDPRFVMTPENGGPLCVDCNQQKQEKPWPEFMARQRAILANLELSGPGEPPPEQLGLF